MFKWILKKIIFGLLPLCFIFAFYSQSEEADLTKTNNSEESAIRVKSLAPYIYDPINKADPFARPTGTLALSADSKPEDRLHPIEDESFDTLTLKAILWSNGNDGRNSKVLVEAKNQTYTFAENDRLGKERALIYRIDQDRIWTMKPYIDPNTGIEGYRPESKRLALSRDTNTNQSELIYER